MTKFLYSGDGPKDYPTLGFSAGVGAILDGNLPTTNTFTSPPDADWAVYGGGSPETPPSGSLGIKRYATPAITPSYTEPQDGHILTYSDSDNSGEWVDPLIGFAAVSDPLIAGRINASGSATDVALARTYARALTLEKASGVDATATTDCAAAIQAAADAATAAKVPLVSAGGQFKLGSGITLSDHCDLGPAVFNFTQTGGVHLTVGPNISRKRMVLPLLVNLPKTISGWTQTTATGVRITNVTTSNIFITGIWGYVDGLSMYGDGTGGGVTYNKIWLGDMLSNKRGVRLHTNGAGYVNQNDYFGGKFNYNLEGAVSQFGSRHILIDSASSQIDGNTFHSPSLESSGACEYEVECYGRDNTILNARWEKSSGAPTVLWQSGSVGNLVSGGVNVDAVVEGISGTTANRIQRSGGVKVLTSTKTFDITDEGKTIIANVAGGTFVLPDVSYRSPGTTITVKNVNATSIAVATTTDPIDASAATKTIAQWESVTFVSQQLPDHRWITADLATKAQVGLGSVSNLSPVGLAADPAFAATATTAQLAAIGNAINTTNKFTGKTVFNTTTGKNVSAVGATAGSVWNDQTGTTAHTPV